MARLDRALYVIYGIVAILLLCLALCAAQEDPGSGAADPGEAEVAAGEPPAVPPPYSELEGEGEGFAASAKYFLSVLFYLILISAMIWGLVWVLKRYGGKSGILGMLAGMRTSTGRGSMRMLETLPLAQGRAIHLVEVGEKVLIVGATPQSVTLIAEIDDENEAAAIRRQSYKTSPFARELDAGQETYDSSAGDAAASLRTAADALLTKSRGLRRRKGR